MTLFEKSLTRNALMSLVEMAIETQQLERTVTMATLIMEMDAPPLVKLKPTINALMFITQQQKLD